MREASPTRQSGEITTVMQTLLMVTLNVCLYLNKDSEVLVSFSDLDLILSWNFPET